jgi:hypothetical protein
MLEQFDPFGYHTTRQRVREPPVPPILDGPEIA